ncbi:uncharacterized protein C8R40DRAFT_528474 [Lentinula edodes]|uniref:uncharacterized protein n=1 Tax=Lentinula edodes TaxID=5353 RepID=UPI001E8EB1CC|nr:uncharacterized protein C8R40DRAFT_528474 [Lentinula edodes]KAH7871738.1 hypothetical protein C8R40DRAFT_528474 [Lentinula edodes]
MTYQPKHSQYAPGRVSDMLHTLRGEQFRHSQNLNRSNDSLSAINAQNALTTRLLNLDYSSQETSAAQQQINFPRTSNGYSGPSPPKSWIKPFTIGGDDRNSPSWRSEALSLIFHKRPSSQKFTLNILSLTQLCLAKLLSECSSPESIEDITPCLPAHLRLELVRYAAIHHPLSKPKLRALLSSEGHVNGELLVTGPSVSLHADHFLQSKAQEREHWDAEDQTTPSGLQCLIVLSTRLSVSTVSTFPLTITHLALINLEHPISLHRLPVHCPSLIVLDLSYNLWLTVMSSDTSKSIDRIDWERWTQLQVLGWKECYIPEGMLTRLNKGRWDDVEVVLG